MGNARALVRGTSDRVQRPALFCIIMVNIGNRIKEELIREDRTVSWLARRLNRNRAAVYRILCKNSIDTGLLLDISRLLNYDFFKEYSAEIHLTDKDLNNQ